MVLGIVGDTYLSVVLVVLLRRQQAKVINKRCGATPLATTRIELTRRQDPLIHTVGDDVHSQYRPYLEVCSWSVMHTVYSSA